MKEIGLESEISDSTIPIRLAVTEYILPLSLLRY